MTTRTTENGPRADHTETATKKNTHFTDQGKAHSTGPMSNSVVTAEFSLDIFTAPKKDSPSWKAGTVTWGEFQTWMDSPADHKECGGYVLGRFEGRRRTKADLIDRCAVALDVDYPEPGFLADALLELDDMAAVIHTTHSSQPGAERYRIIIPLSRRVSAGEYTATAKAVMERLGTELFDAGSSQPERFMWKPGTQRPEWFQFHVLEGEPLEPAEVTVEDSEAPAETDEFAAMPAPTGDRPGDLYADENDWEDILVSDGWELHRTQGKIRFWTKPGGASNPESAKTGGQNDVLHVLSTSAVVKGVRLDAINDSAQGRAGYTKFGYYAAVHHGGDTSATAESLKAQGYVKKPVGTSVVTSVDGDRDIAEAILPALVGRVAHTPGLGWIEYRRSRGVWQSVPDVRILGLVMQESARWAAEMFKRVNDPKQAGKLLSVRNDGKGRRVMSQLATLVLHDDEELDTHPDLLCVGNGVVRLDTGELLSHDPTLMLTKGTRTPYVPGAHHPDWDRALEALPADKRNWFQGRIGQGITGYPPPDDRVVFLRNAGSGAKSTLMSALQRALGEHMTKMPEKVLTAGGDAHPTEITELKGARLAYSEELPEGAKLNVKRLKDIAGTDMMDGRRMHRDTIRWRSTHTMILTTNYLPRVAEVDHGTWRRLVMMEFPFKYVERAEDITDPETQRVKDSMLRPNLTKGHEGRAEAVLAWAVDGARDWYAGQEVMAPIPASVKKDTAHWRGGEDLIAGFIEDHLEFDPEGAVFSDELYEAFRRWQAENGRAEWSSSKFKPRFEQHELVSQHRVETVRTRDTTEVSKDPGLNLTTHRPAGKQYRIVQGVRWAQEVRVP